MNYREFGRTGWKVSEMGFGAWAIGGDAWGQTKKRLTWESILLIPPMSTVTAIPRN